MSGQPITVEPSTGITNSHPRRQKQQKIEQHMSPNTATHASNSGWDHPPAVASPASMYGSDTNFGSWNPRACHWKTPRRLFTLDPSSQKPSDPKQDEKQQPILDFAWGNLFCAPIVVSNKYILVASDCDLSIYGNFDTRDQNKESTTQSRINTTSISPLAKFSLSLDDTDDESFDSGDKIMQLSFHEETSIIYVLTVESSLFQVKLLIIDDLATISSKRSNTDDATPKTTTTTNTDIDSRNKDNGSDDDSRRDFEPPIRTANHGATTSQQPPRFILMHSWITKKLGATCMATLNDGGGIGIDTVCVGYKSGHIEAWNIHNLMHSLDPKRVAQKHRGRHPRNKGEQGVSLDWEGFLYDSIRTLSFLSRCNNKPQTGSRSETDTPGDEKEASNNRPGTTGSPGKDITEGAGKGKEQYLMTIVSISGPTRIGDKGKQQPTSSMLKILDLKRIIHEMGNNNADLGRDGLSLQKYLLPQSRGMELIDASTVSLSKDSRLPKRVPILDSHGANAACNLKNTTGSSVVGRESPSSCTGIAFPDGTVSLLSTSSSRDDTFEDVGIAHADHQVLLSYPAIGNGQIDTIDGNGNPSSYLAACLRGGTCYLIPVSTKNNNNNSNINNNKESIAAIPFSHDIESDLSDIYVQAFTAGNLVVDETNLPILVYAWPSGVIDVYVCGLMDASKAPTRSDDGFEIVDDPDAVPLSRAERRCLQDSIDNESISLVAKILDEWRENNPRNNPLLQMDEWHQLFTETKAGKTLPALGEDITLDSLCSMEFQSLRRILLSLALVDD